MACRLCNTLVYFFLLVFPLFPPSAFLLPVPTMDVFQAETSQSTTSPSSCSCAVVVVSIAIHSYIVSVRRHLPHCCYSLRSSVHGIIISSCVLLHHCRHPHPPPSAHATPAVRTESVIWEDGIDRPGIVQSTRTNPCLHTIEQDEQKRWQRSRRRSRTE